MSELELSSHNAFTLIELLVVIAVISIIAAILFPVFAGVREKARQTACLSNEKQIGLAEMQYVQDNDETFWNQPNNTDTGPFYSDLLMPYIKSAGAFSCPDNVHNTTAANTWDENFHTRTTYPVAYGFADPGLHSREDADGKDLSPYTLAQMQSPAKLVLLSDAVMYWNQTICEPDPDKAPGLGSHYFVQGDPHSPFSFIYYIGQPLHQGGMNFVFADGHAHWGRVSAITPTPGLFVYVGYYPIARALDDDCTQFGQ